MGETGEVELAEETLSDCDPGKQSVRFPISSVHLFAFRKSIPRIALVVSPSAIATVHSKEKSAR